MPKYLFQGAYIGEGLKGLATEGGTPRVEAARQLFGSLGGTLECFYFALGAEDLIVICDLPDNVSAAAFSLAINNTGKAQGPRHTADDTGGNGPGGHQVARVPRARGILSAWPGRPVVLSA